MNFFFLIFLLTSIDVEVEGAKILGIFWTHSKSHHILASNLLQAMAKRGHQIKVISTFIDNVNISNYEQEQLQMADFKVPTTPSFFNKLPGVLILTSVLNNRETSETFWRNRAIQNLIESKEKYDLALFIEFYHDGILGLGHHVGASIVQFSPVGAHSLTHKYVGNPNLAYFPNPFYSEASGTTYSGRLLSASLNCFLYLVENFLHYPIQQNILRRYLPNSSPLSELQNNVSLVLLHSHFSIEPPRPHVPNMVQIGGFYLTPGKRLTADLQTYLDSAIDGVIFFSFGTNVKIADLQKDKLIAILQSFEKVHPVKVLMKSEIDLPNVPENVLVRKWLPQNDILAHPNIRGFITHAGLGGVTEALFHGVPMLAIPFFGDQRINAREAANCGHTIHLSLEQLSPETFHAALSQLLTNSKYVENAKKYSSLLRNRPIQPLDLAIWWMEHIIEHNGGHHLRNKAMDLTWYQLYMIDIMVFYLTLISIVCLCMIYANLYMFRKVRRVIRKEKKN